MGTFPFASTSSRMWNTQLLQYDHQLQNVHTVICLVIFKAHMINLLIIKAKILVLTRWLYRLSQWSWLLSLKWLAYFEHIVQFFLSTCLSNISVHISNVRVQFLLYLNYAHLPLKCGNRKIDYTRSPNPVLLRTSMLSHLWLEYC